MAIDIQKRDGTFTARSEPEAGEPDELQAVSGCLSGSDQRARDGKLQVSDFQGQR
jgi:hypothetical protein